MKFTDKSVGALVAKATVYEVSDGDLPRFKVRVLPSGAKVFYRIESGKERKYKIGRVGEIGCSEAREVAKQVLAEICTRLDPLGVRQEKRVQEQKERSQRLGSFLDMVYYPWAG